MNHLRPAATLLLLFTLLTGVAYPLAVTGAARLLFGHQAGGSLIERDGKTIGSELIGQNFSSEKYFHGRPSATPESPYNAASSSGSNAGPTSRALIDRVRADAGKLKSENPGAAVPADLATTSASGLDPDLTPAAALFQAPRVARARGLGEEQVRELIERHTQPRLLGLFGERTVNVLSLNLALDSKLK